MLGYLKSPDFPIHLMGYWWLAWLGLSLSPLNEFVAPTWPTVAQFLLLIVSFFAGHAVMKGFRPFDPTPSPSPTRGLRLESRRLRWTLGLATAGCFVMLVASLILAEAFDTNFVEYFVKLRIADDRTEQAMATGIRSLDALTKILAFPLSYTVLITTLGAGLAGFRKIFIACLVNIICFAYLWQINYPLMHLFWLMVFYVLVTAQQRGQFSKRSLGFATIVCAVLIASAVYRFGGDILGGLQRYAVGYHLIGFSLYDQHYLDPNSILHERTFGRSALGFLDQVLELSLRPFSLGYRAASSENAEFTDIEVDIGTLEFQNVNAFGTIVFTLYRDFHLIGIVLGGFAYGVAATFTRYRSHRSWRSGALFLMLASAWMMGMMVSPLEAAYFWFVIVTLGLLGIVNRGVRW
jgi:hypothetical protein